MADANNPTGAMDINKLPQDAVALVVFREECGPQPTTVVITKKSYEAFVERISEDGGISKEVTYEFDSPTNQFARRSKFFFSRVTGVIVNFYTGVVPANG